MKNKLINAVVCDAREVTEESLEGYDNVTVNAAVLIAGKRARELFAKHHVTLNVASVADVPDGVEVKTVSGRHEIAAGTAGDGAFLIVNGKLFVEDGALDAVKSYSRILVNGSAFMPMSCKGRLENVSVNGRTTYYPDGAVILDADTKIDGLFIARAAADSYYCPGRLFFLDTAMDADAVLKRGMRFSARTLIVAESLEKKLITAFDEGSKLIRVPDGASLIRGDLELKPKTIRKHGTKLCVCGDVRIGDGEALKALEYLYAGGTVSLDKALEDDFDELESEYEELKLVDPAIGSISDRPAVKVGKATLNRFPNGVRIEDCAKVTLGEELSPDEIMDKLQIVDCAIVRCTAEQEEAVHMIAEDVARITTRNEDEDEDLTGGLFGKAGAEVINAVEYKL